LNRLLFSRGAYIAATTSLTLYGDEKLVACDPSGGTRNITAPSALAATGTKLVVENIQTSGNGTCSLLSVGSQTFAGGPSPVPIPNGTTVSFISNGTNWIPLTVPAPVQTVFTTSNVTAQTSTTCTVIPWSSASLGFMSMQANKTYTMKCKLPVIMTGIGAFQVCLNGPGTVNYNLVLTGALGTSGVWAEGDLWSPTYGVKIGSTAGATVGGSLTVDVFAQIQNGSTPGGIALETAADGTHSLQIQSNATCSLVQDN
jgi:hypothetical protein